MAVGEADIDEIGLLMGGIHGRRSRRSEPAHALRLEKRPEPRKLMLGGRPRSRRCCSPWSLGIDRLHAARL